LLGRAPLYGLAGRGPAGAREVLAILRTELENTLRLLGRTRIGALDAAAVRKR
ncbi:MAG: alpha-hydroxy-acid oxidizing protein, partial [Achromobacter pestifer]